MSPSFNAPRPAEGPNGDLAPVPQPRADGSYERLEEKLSDLATTVARWQSDLENAANRSSRLEGAFSVLLSSLEGWKSDIREVASRTESRVLRGLEVIDSRIARVQPGAGRTDQAAILAAIEKLERSFEERIRTLEGSQAQTPSRLLEGLDRLESRLRAIEQKVADRESDIPALLAESSSHLERRLAEGQQRLELAVSESKGSQNVEDLAQGLKALGVRLAEGQQALTRKLEALSRPEDRQEVQALSERLKGMESRLVDSQEALTRKLDSVLAEGDENNATQLRYLAGLEELQATVAKRIKSLEEIIANPLDRQQWERLAKGLEFLDTKLAQSYDSMANRLDAAIAGLTSTLDNRAAVGHEANVKSAERLWRALRGLEDQITGSYQMVRQSQERLESAVQNLAGTLEELRALTGARAGHTEKLVMEGLENLDGRFNQNLLAVSESLGNALFALNKATGEWRAELFNATEEAEERVVKSITQAEAKLSGDLKSGLDSLGRREERMLALILGGGPSLPPEGERTPESQAPQPKDSHPQED